MQTIKLLSIVSPAYNETKNLALLIPEMEEVLDCLLTMVRDVEWIIADDGSTDGLVDLIKDSPGFVRHLPLQHRGMSAALYDGVMAAQGEIIATLDADGQNAPGDIPPLLETLISSNVDMVCGIRLGRKDSWGKKKASGAANKVRRLIMGDTIVDAGCTLRVFKAETRDLCFWPYSGAHRFVASFAQLQGLKVAQMDVRHRERRQGISHFGILDRLARTPLDLLGAKWLMSRVWKNSKQAKPPDINI